MPTHAELVTPERRLFAGEAEFVVMRTEGGDIMFLPNHADYVGAVDICVLRIAEVGADAGAGADASSPGEVRAAVAGGFVHVADNRITILASVAELSTDIDVARARQALESAESAADGEAGQPSPAADGQESSGEELQGSAMLALLHPDLPEVRARRAVARLEAAGAGDGVTAVPASH